MISWMLISSWPWFNIKMLSYQHRKSHCIDSQTVIRRTIINRMEYPILVRHLYIEMGPWGPFHKQIKTHNPNILKIYVAVMCRIMIWSCHNFTHHNNRVVMVCVNLYLRSSPSTLEHRDFGKSIIFNYRAIKEIAPRCYVWHIFSTHI